MDTKQKLEAALKNAMRSDDKLAKNTLRLALSSIKLAEVEKGQSLDDLTIIMILQKEVKSRQETIREAKKAGREDLIQQNEQEITLLEKYLPKTMPEDELALLAEKVIAEIGANSISDMGKVMKNLMPRLEGRASGDQASRLVRKILS